MKENHVVCRRAAVEAIDPQSNPSGGIVPAEESPAAIGIGELLSSGHETLVVNPEGDRRLGRRNLDDDGSAGMKPQIASAQCIAFTPLQVGQEFGAATGQNGEPALR